MTQPARGAMAVLLVVLVAATGAVESDGPQRQPFYVGARVCAGCHEGPGMGHQFSRWQRSKHALAWAVLATPEAREMARLSGVPDDPQQAMACLGCHSTAPESEDWERDPTFRLEDGVQCERCHGPGSEYIAEDVMRDRERATRAGLRFLSERECALCHAEKGSHVAVHGKPALDLSRARQTIAHPAPEGARPGGLPPAPPGGDAGRPRFAGAQACGSCHRGPEWGYQYSRWLLGPHARAWSALSGPQARTIARAAGVEGDPQRSTECVACHTTGPAAAGAAFEAAWSASDGVGCESCHGPAGDHAARGAPGPRAAAAEACRGCHDGGHGRPFDAEAALAAISHPGVPPETPGEVVYKTPVNLAVSPDGREALVACEASASVVLVDLRRRTKLAEIAVGRQPHDVAWSPDGATAYVSNRLDDSVSVIDVARRAVRATVAVGDEPHGLLTDRSGRWLFVLDTANDAISIVDTASLEEVRRLAASRNPWSLALSPDGERLLVTNNLSRFVEFRTAPVSEVTAVDVAARVVDDRVSLDGTNLVQGVDWHPGGEFALVTLNRTKNLVPMTRILQGWTITNGLGVLRRDGRTDQVLLDEPNLYFPDAADVAFVPDGRRALVTSSGSDRVAVVDVERLLALLERASEDERRRVLPNHLGPSTEFVVTHVPTGASPRGIAVGRDGREAYTADALDDTLTVIDLERLEAVARIDLGGPDVITPTRRGERLFHSANIAFQRQFSCHSCHPDGHVDGITYDIEPDGIGFDPVDNRTLRGILDTAPFKWSGKNATLTRQCGPRLAVFFTRIEPFTPDELADVGLYISTIQRPPNRHRPLGAPLTDAQRRGKALFERSRTNDGRAIPDAQRCVTCHFPPLYTNRSLQDVGTKMELDNQAEFDVPHLTNIYSSAPYMHNGIADTLEEIWTRYNPEDRHGVTNDMTKDQLNDLIEYLKTL